MDEGGKGFLQRWSDRKLNRDEPGDTQKVPSERPVAGRMRTGAPIEDADWLSERTSDVEGGTAKVGGASSGQMTAEEIAAIDFDALDANSDYTRFMQDGVPDWVRRKALSKLYMTNPVFNELDGLDYYDEDFTDAVWAVGDIETSYKVGQGFMSDEEVAEWEALGAPDAETAEEAGADEGPVVDLEPGPEQISESGPGNAEDAQQMGSPTTSEEASLSVEDADSEGMDAANTDATGKPRVSDVSDT